MFQTRLQNHGCFQIVTKILGSRQILAGKKTKDILPNDPILPSFNVAALTLIIMSILLPTVDTLHVFAALLTFRKVLLEIIFNSLSSVISLQSSFSMFFSIPVFTFQCSVFNILEHLLVFLPIYGAQ